MFVEIVVAVRGNNVIGSNLIGKTQIEWTHIKFDYRNSTS